MRDLAPKQNYRVICHFCCIFIIQGGPSIQNKQFSIFRCVLLCDNVTEVTEQIE